MQKWESRHMTLQINFLAWFLYNKSTGLNCEWPPHSPFDKWIFNDNKYIYKRWKTFAESLPLKKHILSQNRNENISMNSTMLHKSTFSKTYIILCDEKIIKSRINKWCGKATIVMTLMLCIFISMERLCRFIVSNVYSIVIQLKKIIGEIRY